MNVRKSAVALWVLVLLGMMIVSGCSPVAVETPIPTPDIAATVDAAVAAALASQPAPDVAAIAEAAVATAMASQPTPDIPATVQAAVATAMATQPPQTVALVTCRDQFVIIDAGMLRANANPDERDEKERFTLLHLENDKVAFRTSDGRFVTATFDEPWVLIAEETQKLGEEQQFTLLDLDNGEVAIRTFYSRYVTAMDDQANWNWKLRAKTVVVSDWERFRLVSPMTPECRRNLLDCGTVVPVYVPNESFCTAIFTSTSNILQVEFMNNQNGSGVAFQFTPALNVQGYNILELRGTSTQAFTFLVEYKVRVSDQLEIVEESSYHTFPADSTTTIDVPIAYDGAIDEIVIVFVQSGQSSELDIESIRLRTRSKITSLLQPNHRDARHGLMM